MRAPRGVIALFAAALLAGAPAPALAQKSAKTDAARKAPEAKPETPADGAPPYEPQLLRLSEIMGALAYLRDLCGDGDGAEYRARMSGLLDAEGKAPERREKLAGAYNRGYLGYETSYSVCTPNARAAIDRFIAEGGRIARDISYHFGRT